MKELYKNPHTFDVNDYYSGLVYVIGGRDFENEEKISKKKMAEDVKVQTSAIKLDWSFLKKHKQHSSVK